ncbi:Yip1 domain protein, putative (macronuclear) [Tetrahymena thermophila SB210]|uniref:Protein YIPF n=1 Tax=Tetrahymena thermophila (strain SB210) TaxID=312017 RepID=Q22KA3_TETTS|nr:Yip1 domain protein, putative [Tetrahymena thermophila SB210]EAR85896.2 Yip1 domain protein, putative [Tetrahymena thermophila SB210]|eukprot:XP_001033559.2 Yip1 domain protein, putative [Tetrahymena thermophila SB210]
MSEEQVHLDFDVNIPEVQETSTLDNEQNKFLEQNISLDPESKQFKAQAQGLSYDPESQQLSNSQGQSQPYDYDNEPPLLEDLGIDLKLIKERIIQVFKFQQGKAQFHEDPDLCGPLLLCSLLGFLMMLSAKLQFGYVFGYGVFGSIMLYLIFNLLLQEYKKIPLYTLISILGYCILPIIALALFNIVLTLKSGFFGILLAFISSVGSTYLSIQLINQGFDLFEKKYLIAYPTFLFYSTFVLITIF